MADQSYATQDTYGPVWQDIVTVGQFTNASAKYPVGLAESIDDYWSYIDDVDGVFGLGLSPKDFEYPVQHQTWLMNTTLTSKPPSLYILEDIDAARPRVRYLLVCELNKRNRSRVGQQIKIHWRARLHTSDPTGRERDSNLDFHLGRFCRWK